MMVGVRFLDMVQGLVLGQGSGSGFGIMARSTLGMWSGSSFWTGVGVGF